MSKNLLSAVPSVSWLWWWWFSHWVISDSYNPLDYSPPGSSAHGISQARILEWLPFPSPGDLPDPGIEPRFPALQENSLPTELPRKPILRLHLPKHQPPSIAATWYWLVDIQSAFIERRPGARLSPRHRNMKVNTQSSLSMWCSHSKAITTQDDKWHNRIRHRVLQSTEKMPNVNLVERGCSESFRGETICYLSLQRLEEDSRQQRNREGRNIQEEAATFSQRRWIQGIVNNLARGKGDHKGAGRKSVQRER